MQPPIDRGGRSIRFTRFALDQAMERGTMPEEIADVLCTGMPDPARTGYAGVAKVYSFAGYWRRRYHREKRAPAFFLFEEGQTIVVTVYVYHRSWSDEDRV